MSVIKLQRSECSVLTLVLKGTWYDLIESGTKREEYREPSEYWRRRFWNWAKTGGCPVVEFRRGYATNAPRIAFWCFGMETASGMLPYGLREGAEHLEWGEPTAPHLVVRLGDRVELEGVSPFPWSMDMDGVIWDARGYRVADCMTNNGVRSDNLENALLIVEAVNGRAKQEERARRVMRAIFGGNGEKAK